MTRGHRDSLRLRCRAFSSPSPCRFIPALSPRVHPDLAAAITFASANQNRSASRVEIWLEQRQRFLDPAARRATAPRSAPAAAARACRAVSGASPRRSHRPSADRPDTRCSLARARRCGRASPRVTAAYRRRRATTQKTSLPPFESRLLTSPLYWSGAEPATADTPHVEGSSSRCPSPGKRQQGPRRRRGRCAQQAAARSKQLPVDHSSRLA